MTNSVPPPSGVYVPAVLFFDENEELDIPPIKSHVLRLAQGGVTGILVQGSNGEAQHLSHDERKETIRVTRQTLDENGFSQVVIIAGTGGQSTRETKKLCKDAAEAGAAFCLVLTPGLWPPQMTPERILQFHREVADASPIPTMVYNFPVVTAGLNLDSDIIGALAQHPNIVGTKLSCGMIGKLQRLTSSVPASKFATFPGVSDVFLPGLVCGSAGLIGALPNIAPKAHTELYRLYKAGKLEEAQKIQALLSNADWELGKLGSIGGIKAMVAKHFGYGNTLVRGPLASADVQNTSIGKLEELIAFEKSL
ncbi:Probable 4-hydroxy-2-oxoglutarate aldolase [Sparassis crispa]|uniref:Probable 4-hydroxy-2-oxoglutarate aldolase n=1 Tax=Sparassis crispa TaxID=139825 RepID=A0A401H1R9_9APHY|nr:Probable 4-hydroxy-2-oxoglutarate aldolase [Sparassis crispa]GBE88310.1 Probable 4-hydroxy-2-oxoglutarate aldolase [Sparassis crispa]